MYCSSSKVISANDTLCAHWEGDDEQPSGQRTRRECEDLQSVAQTLLAAEAANTLPAFRRMIEGVKPSRKSAQYQKQRETVTPRVAVVAPLDAEIWRWDTTHKYLS
eukprot:scpid91608/ scgid17876/ 